ncbi:hypothetical protein J0383_08275 [Flavobacterium endoglycinae]|uniref:TonB C-terminal domain-containing protein n=1 Tax=Flavobacterium endoglycinae TaxID=2816357 RepID=A0ABX7QID2_9FLAO|nr:hypothetical protein [Flavobacterium endoglycinae]QSW90792.1 hypothetical protein J0383_08275 [Flavobacterium endoglycinae]
MERKHKISIPEPCHENWDNMTPTENGRFCMSCAKTVIDFSVMLPEEIKRYFAEHQNERICGRFKKSQLDGIRIQIPNRILYSQTNYHNVFLLSLFIVMGTTLFSCQDKEGNKKKIDKIEVVEDNKSEQIDIEKTVSENKDSIPVNTSQKVSSIKFAKPLPTNCGEIIYEEDQSSLKINDQKTIAQDSIVEGDIYISGAAIETSPYYPGGITNFYQFFVSEFKFPEDAESPKNRIFVSFVIGKDGSLSSFEFPKNIDPKIKAEITRVLSLSPKWQPGEQNGKKTRTKYSLPIAIQT